MLREFIPQMEAARDSADYALVVAEMVTHVHDSHDGRQRRRVGLWPDVRVEPTIAGSRVGRDEALERALAFLRAPAAPPKPPWKRTP